MGSVYSCEWVAEGFFGRLPDLLRPRVLAAGYHLHTEDEGKQVYIRSEKALKKPRKTGFFFHRITSDEIMQAMKLTVSYVLTPRKTTVLFTWDNPYSGIAEMDSWINWLRRQTGTLTDYLDEWYSEVQGEIEST